MSHLASPWFRHNEPVPRPSQPLLNHDNVVQAALQLIDAEGLEKFSLPKLASALRVQTPSLYYHFKDRSDILRAVAHAIVGSVQIPADPTAEDWIEFFVKLNLNFRRAVLKHRNAAPVLLQFLPREMFTAVYEDMTTVLTAAKVPADRHVLILDGMERFALGATLTEAMGPPRTIRSIFPSVRATHNPNLAAAVRANGMNPSQLAAEAVRSFLIGAIR